MASDDTAKATASTGLGAPYFRCTTCGEEHPGPTMVWGPHAPESWDELPADERRRRGKLTSDGCIIDGTAFYVRGCLHLIIDDGAPKDVVTWGDVFTWLVWVRVSREAYKRVISPWRQITDRGTKRRFAGTLDVHLPYEPATRGLAVEVVTGRVAERPYVVVSRSDHPLSVEQRGNISRAHALEMAHAMTHAVAARSHGPRPHA